MPVISSVLASGDTKTSTHTAFTGRNVKTFIPKVESFMKTNQVAENCKPGKIGIVYDCVNSIPLASMVLLKSDDYRNCKHVRLCRRLRQSHVIGIGFQQQDLD